MSLLLILALVFVQKTEEIEVLTVTKSLNEILNFIKGHNEEMNFDVAVALTLAEAQLQEALLYDLVATEKQMLRSLIQKCQVSRKILKRLSSESSTNDLLARFLIDYRLWIINKDFFVDELEDLAIYQSWTIADVLRNKSAEYNGIHSNDCLEELLASGRCFLSDRCRIFMFGKRLDTAYVLTHRLLFLHVMQMARCFTRRSIFDELTRDYCALMLKEAKTNELLGFPQHDLFLEQVTLCGLEGFSEFLNDRWTRVIIQWMSRRGCYKDVDDKLNRRSANHISYGCVDHTTGLAAAALSTILRYTLYKLA
ncbi:hypothetical protein FQA39_LY04143 [Lamprigera yunnana]|nr:hypothetical protein FQA39_LY04143 [Lamprigera yunnana]